MIVQSFESSQKQRKLKKFGYQQNTFGNMMVMQKKTDKIIIVNPNKVENMSVTRRASQNGLQNKGQKFCCKHSGRIALYQLVIKANTKVQCFYCQKCSIMLASQGFHVVRIDQRKSGPSHKSQYQHKRSKSSIMTRQNQIGIFMEALKCTKYQLESKLQGIQDYLISSQRLHERLMNQANTFYTELAEQIQLQKYITYNSILNKRLSDERDIRRIRQVLIQGIEDVQNIIDDIKGNINTMENVENGVYQKIIGCYKGKCSKMEDLADGKFQIKGIQECFLVLPRIPSSLKTLSDKISIQFVAESSMKTNFKSFNFVGQNKKTGNKKYNAYVSQPSFNEKENIWIENISNYKTVDDENRLLSKQNWQMIKSYENLRDLAFSFDEISSNPKQIISISGAPTLKYDRFFMKELLEGQSSKIEEKIDLGQIYESEESFGVYVNKSQSKEIQNSFQEAETLLIV